MLALADFLTIEKDSETDEPDLNLKRLKSGITSGDELGRLKWRGSNSGGKEAHVIYAEVRDPTAGSEDARLNLKVRSGGVNTFRLKIQEGIWGTVGGVDVAGDDIGEGTTNFQDYFRRGTLLPVQEAYDSGEQTITAAA